MTSLLPPIQSTQNASLSAQSAQVISSATNRATARSDGADKNAAQLAAEEFETTFLNTMLQTMFEGIEAEAPFGGGYGEKVFRSMMVSEYAKDIASSGGIGLANEVYREILAQQEGRNS